MVWENIIEIKLQRLLITHEILNSFNNCILVWFKFPFSSALADNTRHGDGPRLEGPNSRCKYYHDGFKPDDGNEHRSKWAIYYIRGCYRSLYFESNFRWLRRNYEYE